MQFIAIMVLIILIGFGLAIAAGVVAFILQVIFGGMKVAYGVKYARNAMRLRKEGTAIQGRVEKVDYSEGLSPIDQRVIKSYQVIVRATDPQSGQERTYQSSYLSEQPILGINAPITIYVDRSDPTNYLVDVPHRP